MQTQKIIAAFDFDGTITKRDVLIFFFIYTFGYWKTLYKLILLLPFFIEYLFRQLIAFRGMRCKQVNRGTDRYLSPRQKMKEKILTQFLSKIPRDKLLESARAFSQSELLKKQIRPAALKRIAWHQQQGHHCVLVSAGIDLYLNPWGELMGFQTVIASQLELSFTGEYTGKLKGANCWGAEKVRRLEEQLGPKKEYLLYAYGDSRGDRELLSLADYPYYKKIDFLRN
jgi:phosphatidylglycerophosphatase C